MDLAHDGAYERSEHLLPVVLMPPHEQGGGTAIMAADDGGSPMGRRKGGPGARIQAWNSRKGWIHLGSDEAGHPWHGRGSSCEDERESS